MGLETFLGISFLALDKERMLMSRQDAKALSKTKKIICGVLNLQDLQK